VTSRAAALLAATALFAGCSGGGGPKPPAGSPAQGTHGAQPPGDEAQLQSLLDRRARALQAGRVRAYAATATGAQRAEDRRVAADARGLPLRDVRLRTVKADIRDGRAVLDVRSSYAIAGVRGHFDAGRTVRAVKTKRGWRVRSVTSRRQQHPWEIARFIATRSPHFTVLAPATVDTTGLTDTLEGGYARMSDILADGRLRRRYLVVIAGDASQARRMTAGIRGVATLAAISDAAVREEGAAERVASVASQRLLIVWPEFAPLDPDGRLRVVAHELTHAALAASTSGRTPSWLVEGAALYVSGDRRVQEAARRVASGRTPRALTLTGLSAPSAIARLGGEGQSAGYSYASAAAFYLIERYGRARFFRLYDAFNSESLPGDPGPTLADRAVRRTLGISLMGLERDLRRWILDGGLVP
jgi:hypothetical protein